MVVLGIDPGTANTGFGVVASRKGRLVARDGGVIITAPELDPAERLLAISRRVGELIREHSPEAVSLESVYFGRNVGSAFAVGQARGAILVTAAESGVPCFDYTPQQIKAAVCGSGSAGKDQVARMVQQLLSLAEVPTPDHAADALAAGICHASHSPLIAATG